MSVRVFVDQDSDTVYVQYSGTGEFWRLKSDEQLADPTFHLPAHALELTDAEALQEDVYQDGYDEGYSNGVAEGDYAADEAYDEGYSAGKEHGYEEGYTDGRESAVEEKG